MGCVSSTTKHPDGIPPTDGEENEKIAKRQRRRLSVAPQHVGDITLAAEEKAAADRMESIVGGLLPDEEGLSPLELQAKGKMRHALKSKKGVVPYNRNKVNQDRPVLKYAIGDDPSVSLFGVMDGHGEFGHQVAQFVQDKLPYHLSQEHEIKQDPDHYITLAVKNLCDELKQTNINVAFSGTTCVFGVRVDQKLYVANIGDSRCVLARQLENGDVQAIGLSEDQKPENPKEKARILKEGGRVEPLPGPPGEDCGPPRVWLAEVDVPGLAMSRSIGDEVSQTVGVISVPEIKQHTIQHNDILAVWASDGVWEFISNEQAISVIWKYRHDLQEAANQLVEEAHRQWKKEEEVVDDITCVIVQFNPSK